MGTCEKKTVTALPKRKIRGKDSQNGSFNSLLNGDMCHQMNHASAKGVSC